MVTVYILLLGLCFGSFVNALVFRLHEQEKLKDNSLKPKVAKTDYSIIHGRSMCVNCHHKLAWYDLLPVVSWLSLGGKCRYCKKPISVQYPFVELLTASLFGLSYLVWPYSFTVTGWLFFGAWLIVLVGLVALTVYDYKWMQLPFKITYPLIGFWVVVLGLADLFAPELSNASFFGAVWSGVLFASLFWLLWRVSDGKWLGGGDVPLAGLLGMLSGNVLLAMLLLFLASTLGTTYALPLMVTKKLTPTSRIPFGPSLIISGIIVFLFSMKILSFIDHGLLPY